MERDFGPGPFTVHGVEDWKGGQWVSLMNPEGLVWVKDRWESPEADESDPELGPGVAAPVVAPAVANEDAIFTRAGARTPARRPR